MRPTLLQLYHDPLAIIAALDRAGVENAHAKVMGIFAQLIEYWSMHEYVERMNKDRTYLHQSEERRARIYKSAFDAEQRRRDTKQIGEYNKVIIVGRGNLKRRARLLEGKIAKWPDLDIDPSTLRKKLDHKLIKQKLKFRRRRSRNRFFIIG